MPLSPRELRERFKSKVVKRAIWENHWQELADFILPNKNSITTKRSKGEKTNTHLFDNTAIQANELLAGALHGLLTNPYTQWFELYTGNPDIDSDDGARLWLQDSTRRMHTVINDSNFQTEIHEYYLDLPAFGTAPLLMEEDEETIVRFMAIHIGNIYISENNKGFIDEAYRTFEWPARLIVANFGLDEANLSKKVMSAYKQNSDEVFKLLHGVYPNADTDSSGKLSNFPFISHYTVLDEDEDISVKGFNEFPFIIGRWSKISDEEYGRGPGMTALPEAKTINKMTEMTLLGAAKMINPPLQMPDDGFVLPLKTFPGGVNYYRAGGTDRVEALLSKDFRIDFGEAMMEKHRQRIREAFFVDQLQLGTGPQMTATEVNQRTEEKLRLLAPVLGRQQNETLGPIVSRLFKIMDRKKLFLPMPDIIRSAGGLGVRYSSQIARIQKQAEGDNILKTVQAASPFIQADPTVLDNFDGDESIREIARIYNFPQKMIRPKVEVEKIRKGRQQAQEQAAQQQQQTAAADNLSKVKPAIQG